MARVDALFRRVPSKQELGQYRFGDISVDFPATEVKRAGQLVALSAREFQLLRFLIEHRDKTLSRDLILKNVWGYSPGTVTRTVDVRIEAPALLSGLRIEGDDDVGRSFQI